MGANHSSSSSSTWPESNGSTTKKPLVIAFHSSMNWRIHFDASKQTKQLMVIDFTATWCGPCKYMEPIVHEFAAHYSDVEFVKIDVDELGDVAQDFGVESMPTFVLVKKGKVIEKVIGADREQLQKKIQKHRY
ncbi:thioredoxin H2-like [Ipomoea triloba]|uniref:thioredoxin H2-like n=1 Tax=Ipomoea triloba TaxID=35885 RepID=UPI00125DFAFA|nr:thioredoxin H2-like [Ipomoea triloba]